jgi:hypothetical protein
MNIGITMEADRTFFITDYLIIIKVNGIFVHTGSGVHPTSYPMGTGGSFSRGRAAGA